MDLSNASVLVDYRKLLPDYFKRIQADEGYGSLEAQVMDAAYQGIVRGIIPNESNRLLGTATINDICSNYRFMRRFFGLHWYIYVYLMRMVSLNNPFRETFYFIKNIAVKKLQNILPKEQSSHESELKMEPLVSIIIPTLNRYEYLRDVLLDLENQDYKHFEVLVCDQSEPVNELFYAGWKLNLTLLKQEEKALWLARNTCIRSSKGDYILLFDDDSRVKSDWIRNHLLCLEKFNVSISAGVTHTLVGHGLSFKETYYHISDAFDTGNALVKKSVFKDIGLFDRQFEKQRMGDGEFGLRAFLAGYQMISNPYAMRVHLKVEKGGLRQMGSWDGVRPKYFFAPRPIPSVLYMIKKYFGYGTAIFYIFQNVPSSYVPYKWKKSKLLKLFSFLSLPLIFPVMLYSIIRSWKEAGEKLKQGSRIEYL